MRLFTEARDPPPPTSRPTHRCRRCGRGARQPITTSRVPSGPGRYRSELTLTYTQVNRAITVRTPGSRICGVPEMVGPSGNAVMGAMRIRDAPRETRAPSTRGRRRSRLRSPGRAHASRAGQGRGHVRDETDALASGVSSAARGPRATSGCTSGSGSKPSCSGPGWPQGSPTTRRSRAVAFDVL
jgi:hypothetical protein